MTSRPSRTCPTASRSLLPAVTAKTTTFAAQVYEISQRCPFRIIRTVQQTMAAMDGDLPAGALPNLLITGTPGTGKSLTAAEVCSRTGMRHIDVGLVAKQQDLYDGFDDHYQCPILDEDKVIDELEEVMGEKRNVVEYHGCDFFPERWFDAVIVLRTDNTLLYDRLLKRGYSGQKLTDNVQCEIFQTILEEARDNYSHDIIHELPSNTPENLEQNVDTICSLVSEWSLAHHC